ncbi:hypothetical protein H4Q32_003505 [Labeo rohita]|uniref:RNase H type-1 domain-containing protein n=1 Tax=Labeo rohita TaxID=84645 RepID=A0ABQ8MWL8_LABRO|nr:hypothetical protein H4Q32_003505 [Labeo rohita]
MRCLIGNSWGASMKSLRHIYTALIRSTLDYACITYGSAAKSHLQKLDVIQAQALRLCCGAFKTSPVPALQVEAGEMPLSLRQLQLSMTYWTTLQGHRQEHPTKAVLNKCWEHGRKQFDSFGWVGDSQAETLGLTKISHRCTVALSAIPPWFLPMPAVDLEISKISKHSRECGGMNNMVQQYLSDKYNDMVQIYTDGSKDPDTGRTGAAVYIPEFDISIKQRTSDNLAVYSVELLAILLALIKIEDFKPNTFVVCSDSMAALVSILNLQSTCRLDLVYDIFQSLYRLSHRDTTVCFIWVPAHVEVDGNEVVDSLAKKALSMNSNQLDVPLSRNEIKTIIKAKVNNLWQKQWHTNSKGRFLHKIQQQVPSKRRGNWSRRGETIITRLRIGHSNLNYNLNIIGKHNNGQCSSCNQAETVIHVLIDCPVYNAEREVLLDSVKALGYTRLAVEEMLSFSTVRPSAWKHVMTFLKSTRLYERI